MSAHWNISGKGLSIIIANFIVGFMSYYISIYIYNKIENNQNKDNCISTAFLIVGSALNGLIYAFLCEYNQSVSIVFNYLFPSMFIMMIIKNRRVYLAAVGFISTSLMHILKVLSAVLLSILLSLINPSKNEIIYYSLLFLITYILAIMMFRIKRFRKGFQFLDNSKYLGLGTTVTGIVFILTCIDYDTDSATNILLGTLLLGIFIAGFGLYLWIRRSITSHYRERLQLKSEEHFKHELEERDREIEKLNQSNAYLSKVVHRDNHLMSNLNTSIDMYFNSDDEAYKDNLLRELQILSNERGEQINKEQLESKLLPSTGNLLIDSAIGNLYIKAAAHGIDFNLTVSSTVDEIIGKFISQTDLQTLLCDHIKDAIIAVESKGESGGKILVNLSNQNDNYCIDIYDNGVAFAPETLSKLGLERVTTHADSGGSGIGFMTTFETLKKAYASLIITEFENQIPFSKSVSFRFDVESSFIVHSYRKDELKELITRNDIIIVN